MATLPAPHTVAVVHVLAPYVTAAAAAFIALRKWFTYPMYTCGLPILLATYKNTWLIIA